MNDATCTSITLTPSVRRLGAQSEKIQKEHERIGRPSYSTVPVSIKMKQMSRELCQEQAVPKNHRSHAATCCLWPSSTIGAMEKGRNASNGPGNRSKI